MKANKDTHEKEESLLSWTASGGGKYFSLPFYADTHTDGLFLMFVFYFRRKLFSGKRLNIFSPSTEEAIEPAAGNLAFLFKMFLSDQCRVTSSGRICLYDVILLLSHH